MGIIYNKETHIDVENFIASCQAAGKDPKKVVFIFPGNALHHGPGTTLFSVKSGDGLAIPAGQLGMQGYPVLSLPTTHMGNYPGNLSQKQTVHSAVADLYRAAGAGYDLMLPVRDFHHNNNTYFQKPLNSKLGPATGQIEPSFWGKNCTTPNPQLAQYYIDQLNELHEFMALSEQERVAKANSDKANAFYQAYLDGIKKKNNTNDPWLQPDPKATAPYKSVIEKGSDLEKIISAYNSQYQNSDFYKEPESRKDGSVIVTFQSEKMAETFLDTQASNKLHFFMKECDKSFEDGHHFYSCGDGQLYKGTAEEIMQQMHDYDSKTPNEDTKKGIAEFQKTISKDVSQAFKEKISKMHANKPTPASGVLKTAVNTPPPPGTPETPQPK